MAWVSGRKLAYFLGYRPDWEGEGQTLTFWSKRRQATFQVGSMYAKVDGADLPLPAAPRLRAGHVWVPCRAVCRALGYQVETDPATATLWLSRASSLATSAMPCVG